MYIYLISLILVIIAVAIFHFILQTFWCATGLAVAKLILYVSFGRYAWWGCLFTALIIYVLAYLYFWLLLLTRNKPFAYWPILVIGFLRLML